MDPTDDTLEPIFWRDEILQIMYWLRGEELGEIVAPRDLVPFLEIEEEDARAHLLQMKEDGYVACPESAPGSFQLTEFGVSEGKRLFAAEFAGLTAQGHGECSNPDCACHTLGPEACESHLPEAPHHHE